MVNCALFAGRICDAEGKIADGEGETLGTKLDVRKDEADAIGTATAMELELDGASDGVLVAETAGITIVNGSELEGVTEGRVGEVDAVGVGDVPDGTMLGTGIATATVCDGETETLLETEGIGIATTIELDGENEVLAEGDVLTSLLGSNSAF